MPLRVEEGIQDPTLVEEKKNALANEEELLVEKGRVEEQHQWKTIKNVWLGLTSSISPLTL